MRPGSIAVPIAAIVFAQALVGSSQEAKHASVGRGWPVSVTSFGFVSGGREGESQQTAFDGQTPAGIEPLPVDMFTTKDFYADSALWTDRRYYRCNSPTTLQGMWDTGTGPTTLLGTAPPKTASWGNCDVDYPREAIVSPYPFKTAQEHYEALLKETRAKGGPTLYTREKPPPDWNGRYSRAVSLEFLAARAREPYVPPAEYLAEPPQWFFTSINQTSTIVSLLTPEYQKRTVQMHYHQTVDDSQLWPGTFCWPDGFLRVFSRQAHLSMDFVTTPERLQVMASSAENFIRHFNVGREFDMSGDVPRLGQDVPRWFGESVAFWDGDALITWTSNVMPWITHGVFEHSGKIQTIEIFTPRFDASGKLGGIEQETILYDPEALAAPVRIIQVHVKTGDLDKIDPIPYTRCIQTIFPIEGRPQPVSPGTTIEYTVPDMFGRPWAQIWERYFEQGMDRPVDESLFDFE